MLRIELGVERLGVWLGAESVFVLFMNKIRLHRPRAFKIAREKQDMRVKSDFGLQQSA